HRPLRHRADGGDGWANTLQGRRGGCAYGRRARPGDRARRQGRGWCFARPVPSRARAPATARSAPHGSPSSPRPLRTYAHVQYPGRAGGRCTRREAGTRGSAPLRDASMQVRDTHTVRIGGLDGATRELVELAIVIATAYEPELRAGMRRAAEAKLKPEWVEELILQSYIYAGFPRALNAAREWRRASGIPAPRSDEDATNR